MPSAKAHIEPKDAPELETSVPVANPPEPSAPESRHPLNMMADLFRTEACGASGPVALSLFRLADAFDSKAKELS